jgi:hypothetical protein
MGEYWEYQGPYEGVDTETCEIHNLPKSWAPDPFCQEIYEDDTDYYQCDECREESAQAI